MSEVLRDAFGGLGALLVGGSLVVWGLLGRRTGRGHREVRLRLKTWWALAGLLLLALAGPPWLAIGLMAGTSFVALREFLTLAPTRPADHGALLLAYAAIPAQYLWVGVGWYGMFLVFIPVYVFLLLPLRLVLAGEPQGFLRAVGTLHWGLTTTVFSLSHVAYLLVLPARPGPHGAVDGAGLVFFLLVLTQLNDVAQYLWGKWLGRRRITPVISPNNTREGLLGGVLTTTVLAGLAGPWLTPLPVLSAAGSMARHRASPGCSRPPSITPAHAPFVLR